jgi:predicted DCC family thiol-disulfide oxidoreductase YuxK
MEVVMDAHYPLTVYFDASCPMCHSEILNIKAHDNNGQLRLVDCSAPDFSDAPFRREDVSRSDMMTRLHVRDSQGAWIKGTDAMELIYRTAGMQRMARLWERHALLGRLYPRIARNRQALSLTGIPMLFVLWRKWQVWRIHRNIQACKNGKCTL